MTPAELESALGGGPFRFRMGLRKVDDVGLWLRSHREDASAAAARMVIARNHPERFDLASEADRPRLGEALERLAALAGITHEGAGAPHPRRISEGLGLDLMLVERTSLLLEAIAVAFPSGWAPEEALGKTASVIHAIVPQLESELGASIERFLVGLQEGRAYARENVGIAVGDELDRHPASHAPRASASTPLDELRLRIEHQCFFGLDPHTLVFFVSVRQEPLSPLLDAKETAATFGAYLEAMPEDVARYKGIAEIRPRILERIARTCDPS